ncbi:hypothetical protein [Geosporobacter ferrireducens]|uniref:Uncharacterized protein n=1 Tax=Geosporobacter ferrireducens TaxID=1424294 RepID=A0A1D8GGA0_9FIRM|nr:hypothetical protein [Geosporobacter ferrireducens]AOT69952.1 hypothetical protein Gferi_10365 [Geosporobacter ferrireducens]
MMKSNQFNETIYKLVGLTTYFALKSTSDIAGKVSTSKSMTIEDEDIVYAPMALIASAKYQWFDDSKVVKGAEVKKEDNDLYNKAIEEVKKWLHAEGIYYGSYLQYYDDIISDIELKKSLGAGQLVDLSTTVGYGAYQGVKAGEGHWSTMLYGGGIGALEGFAKYISEPGYELSLDYELEKSKQIRDSLGDYRYLMRKEDDRKKVIALCNKIEDFYSEKVKSLSRSIELGKNDERTLYDSEWNKAWSIDELEEIKKEHEIKVDYAEKIKKMNINYKQSIKAINNLFKGF